MDDYLADPIAAIVGTIGKGAQTLPTRKVPQTPTGQTRVNRLVAPPTPAATAGPDTGVAMIAQAIEV